MRKKRYRRLDGTTGSAAIEIAVASLLFVIFVILAFDMLVVVWGYSVVDSAARDAARAAASTSNAAAGLQAAQQAALAHRTDGYFVSQPKVAATATDFIYVTPATGSPYVAVTTRADVRLPVPIQFFGAQLKDGLLPYARTYTFPILGVPFVPDPGSGAAPPPVVAPPAP
ncbi:MAG: pilus assembly protein, partial [Candidatus Obscuribacter phosphatis]|nr:pilus assembly protein [Candidatus Obscuribacter phosphatis]